MFLKKKDKTPTNQNEQRAQPGDTANGLIGGGLDLGAGPQQQPATGFAGSAGTATGAANVIFDTGTEQFEQQVLQASMDTPVIVDFWAPWCGPCKQLMPVLEQAVQAAGGKVKLAKVNIDEHPELAQALRVQSVPTVFAFFQGRPVNAFSGVKAASEIKMFVDQLVKAAQQARPDAIDIPAALKQAGEVLAAGDLGHAQQIYMAVLSQDEKNAAAYAGLIRTLIAAGALDQAQEMLDGAPAEIAMDSQLEGARSALALAKEAPQGDLAALKAQVEKDPADHRARYDLANGLFAAGAREEAIDHLVESIRRNREWEEGKAKELLLKFFDALGPADPVTIAGRRKLSSVLFS